MLSWTSLSQYDHTEDRLLRLRVREAGSLIAEAIPTIQTPLASAVATAEATAGDAAQFRSVIGPYVGTGKPFTSASLWSLASAATGPIAVAGLEPALRPGSPFVSRATRTPGLVVNGPVGGGTDARLGYAYSVPGSARGYFAYGESVLPANRRLRIASNSAFADLDYALYVTSPGHGPTLLATSLATVPVHGRQSSTAVPFGDASFTLVMAPRVSLSGSLPERLPWLIAIIGSLLSLAAAVLGERLVRRRLAAEGLATRLDRLADENRLLYAEQRNVAETLQHALLPEELPSIEGLDISTRYVPGSREMEIGGDWYDAVVLGQGRLMVVVGDVSGRGLRAATIMAELRYGARAYAAQGDPPAVILAKLSHLVSVEKSGHFATVLCAEVDVARHAITVANAGHPPPLVVDGSSGDFVAVDAGVPVGVTINASYPSTTIILPPRATLLAYTDGLVERRGETIDVGLARLRAAATGPAVALDDLVTTIVSSLLVEDSEDDSAILGVRWRG